MDLISSIFSKSMHLVKNHQKTKKIFPRFRCQAELSVTPSNDTGQSLQLETSESKRLFLPTFPKYITTLIKELPTCALVFLCFKH